MPAGLVRTRWFYHGDNDKFPVEEEVDPATKKKWIKIGPIAPPIERMKLIHEQQKKISDETLCWPVIRYRGLWHIMGRVNVHEKMHGMLWL